MNSLLALIKSEPVLFQGVMQAGLAMLIGFEIHLTPGQSADILAFSAAVLAFWARSQVVPAIKKEEK